MVAQPFDAAPELPLSFRGYSREAIDAFLEQVEDGYLGLVAERDELRRQLEELKQELADHRKRAQLVSDALVRAERVAAEVRADAEREMEAEKGEIAAVRSRTLREAEEVLAQAKEKAEAILTQAREDADRRADEVLQKLSDQQYEAEHLLDDTRARLATLVTDLIKQLPVGTAGNPGIRSAPVVAG